ncbi:hypothetical protein [Brevundimonas sp. M20]|uniref:hypothetical protein n=1 Tax=Brevundimonas sp. M20 TaxID=2591463 RepID=UPI00114764C7|nr:hypothetical protein [Brevundimonas sp. M20]QDH73777.1 hypothetical protein FKQ52_10290 [Brevundimonas sp. M20]
MADGALTLELDAYTVGKIAERAKAMGIAPEELAAMVLDARFFDYDDFSWINGDPRSDAVEPSGLHETGRPWKDVRPEFLALIDKTFGKPE